MTEIEIEIDGLRYPQYGYRNTAPAYVKLGFQPIPVSGKVVVAPGLTGRHGAVTKRTIEDLRHKFPNLGTAIRANGWIAIDVDHHDEKYGDGQLRKLEETLGKLPATVSSTARGKESLSRQYFFKVDTDEGFVSDPTPDIEIIHKYHRYSVVSPSIHPALDTPYIWYDIEGEPIKSAPEVTDFATLPSEWRVYLTKRATSGAANTSEGIYAGELTTWEKWLDSAKPTSFTQSLMDEIAKETHIGHDALLEYVREIHALRNEYWERGCFEALKLLKKKYFESTRETNPHKEIEDVIRWVIGDNWEPRALSEKTAAELVEGMFSTKGPNREKEFWSSRKILQNIHKLARQKTVAPWTIFAMVMLRTLNSVPYDVYLVTYRNPVPLNTLVAFVGPTGTGKTLALGVTNRGFIFPDSDPGFPYSFTWNGAIEPGSGEAMSDFYKPSVKGEDGKFRKEWINTNHAVLFGLDEIGMLESRSAREGSTITDYMKSGWSGAAFGRTLVGGGGTLLPDSSYRFGLFINAQPARSQLLFTDKALTGGLPSRFLFFSTQDPLAEKEFDSTASEVITMPKIDWSQNKKIYALPEMNDAFKKEAFKSMDGGLPAIDSHILLTRSKVAVALAIMDGRRHLESEDWELSGIVVEHSKSTRQTILDAISTASSQNLKKAGAAAGIKTLAAEDIAIEKRIKRAAVQILKKRGAGIEEANIRKLLRSDIREYFEDACSFIESNPDFEVEDKS